LASGEVYRLISATGREHAGGVGDDQRDQHDLPLWSLPHANDAQALRQYTESYGYDGVGNILEMFHNAGNGSPGTWRRNYAYGANPFGQGAPVVPESNRVHSTSLPGDPTNGPFSATYSHDANGNMVSMPHLASIEYSHTNQMREADLGGGGTAYYTYDATGERVRKVIQRIGTTREERIYLGGWELYRRRQGANQDLVLERETLHVMDDARRIAMVETKTVDADVQGTLAVVPRTRYQYSNHLDSAYLECDEVGLVISYEEYHPYGTPAYRSARAGVEVSKKRYRYTGKERDEETGFQYHSARYLVPWLGRWTSADPAGMVDGPNLYQYARSGPIAFMDPTGTTLRAQPNYVGMFLDWLLDNDKVETEPAPAAPIIGFAPAVPMPVAVPAAVPAAAAPMTVGVGPAPIIGVTAQVMVHVGQYFLVPNKERIFLKTRPVSPPPYKPSDGTTAVSPEAPKGSSSDEKAASATADAVDVVTGVQPEPSVASAKNPAQDSEKPPIASDKQTPAATTSSHEKVIGESVALNNKKGESLAELDVVKTDRFVEQTSAEGLGTVNPRTGKPSQTTAEWAEKEVSKKANRIIESLLGEAVATAPGPEASRGSNVPKLEDINHIRHIHFEFDSDTAEIRAAVGVEIAKLQHKFSGWTFTSSFGKR